MEWAVNCLLTVVAVQMVVKLTNFLAIITTGFFQGHASINLYTISNSLGWLNPSKFLRIPFLFFSACLYQGVQHKKSHTLYFKDFSRVSASIHVLDNTSLHHDECPQVRRSPYTLTSSRSYNHSCLKIRGFGATITLYHYSINLLNAQWQWRCLYFLVLQGLQPFE